MAPLTVAGCFDTASLPNRFEMADPSLPLHLLDMYKPRGGWGPGPFRNQNTRPGGLPRCEWGGRGCDTNTPNRECRIMGGDVVGWRSLCSPQNWPVDKHPDLPDGKCGFSINHRYGYPPRLRLGPRLDCPALSNSEGKGELKQKSISGSAYQNFSSRSRLRTSQQGG